MFYITNNRSYLFVLFFLVGILSAIGQNNAKTLNAGTIPLDPAVRYGQLDNGFTYYIRRNQVPQEETQFQMVVKAGTFHEDEDQQEYAHLLEHMGAKGTKNFPRLPDFFKSSGGTRTARTYPDNTPYWGWLPSGDNALVKKGLQVVRDWAHGISLEQESIDVEREAVLAEMRTTIPSIKFAQNTVRNVMDSNWDKLINKDKRTTSIKNFNLESFLRFYEDWYRPDLQAAIIVGDVDVDSIELEVKRLFADLEMPEQPRDAEAIKAKFETQLNGKNQYVTVIDSVWSNFQLDIVSMRPNVKWQPKTVEDYKAIMVEEIFQELLQTRINALSRQYNPPFNYFNPSSEFRDKATVNLRINFDNNNPAEIKEKLFLALTTLRRISAGITKKDVSKAKANILKKYSREYLKSSTLAEQYRNHFVKGAAAPGLGQERTLIVENLNQITLKDVEKYIQDCLDMKRNTDFIFFTPKKNIEIPDSSAIKKMIAQVEAEAIGVQPYTDEEDAITSLKKTAKIPFENTSNIECTSESLLDVTTIKFSNGIRLLLKPDKPYEKDGLGRVALRAYRPNGILAENREEYLMATVAGEVVEHAGAGPYNKFTLQDYMDNYGIRGLKINLNHSDQTIFGSCKEGNLEEMLELLYLYTDNPRKDQEAFRDWKEIKREQLYGKGRRGSNKFFKEAVIAARSPEVPVMDVPTFDQLTIDKLYAVYDRWFSGFSGYTFVITGDYDKDHVASVLVKYLSAFPEGSSPNGKVAKKSSIPLKKMDSIIYLNNLDQALVRLHFPVMVPTDVKAKAVFSIISKALRERVWDRLREGCYSPSAYGRYIDSKNGLYEFVISFDSELENQAKMFQNAMEEFRLLRDEGVNKQEFEKLLDWEKAEYSKRINEYPSFWYEYLKEKLDNGENPETELLQYKAILENFISVEDVNAAAKDYLREEYLQQFIGLPKGN